jgi:hypothetical protein
VTSYANVGEDLAPRFPRPLTEDEQTRAAVLLEDASFRLGILVPGLDAEVTAGNEVATQAAKLLVVAMVRRTLLQPDLEEGATSQTDTFGPFSFTVAHSNPDGSLFLYDRELADITDLLRSNRAAAVSMRSPGL